MELLKNKLGNITLFILACLPLTLCAALPQDIASEVQIHELEIDHPVRKSLDKLFKKSRFITNVETLKKAGFHYQGPRKHTGLIVAKHRDAPGYIFKIYTDVQEYYKQVPEYQLWLMRIEGARRIREYVASRQWDYQFKVPRKWIYIIPESSKGAKGYYTKQTILVEEDMQLRSEKTNLAIWKGNGISKTLLEQLYQIITDLGLRDCAKPDNIPFSKDGKIAFIDTQTFQAPPISYHRLTPHLNRENRQYWLRLTKEGR